jgi:hypothetical protein
MEELNFSIQYLECSYNNSETFCLLESGLKNKIIKLQKK